MSELPTNIQEFNKICALVFARLYQTFPRLVDVDRKAIAETLGITDPSELDSTLTWLARNDYTKITAKSLAADHTSRQGLSRDEFDTFRS
jgi:hypothetical protein